MKKVISFFLAVLMVVTMAPVTVFAEVSDIETIENDQNNSPYSEEDYDNDGISNIDEEGLGTDPYLTDSDFDDLTDYFELEIGSNPVLADTDSDGANDGIEVENGTDLLCFDSDFTVIIESQLKSESFPVSMSASVIVSGESLENVSVNPVLNGQSQFISSTMSGYIGNAFEISSAYGIKSAEIKFEYYSSAATEKESFEPVVYYFNEETQDFDEVPNQKSENDSVIARVNDTGIYILLNKTEYETFNEFETFSVEKTESTNLEDYYDDIYWGRIPLVGGSYSFVGYDFSTNNDYDGDGLFNNQEIEIRINSSGNPEIYMHSNPVYKDSDGDGIDDGEDTYPLKYSFDVQSSKAIDNLLDNSIYAASYMYDDIYEEFGYARVWNEAFSILGYLDYGSQKSVIKNEWMEYLVNFHDTFIADSAKMEIKNLICDNYLEIIDSYSEQIKIVVDEIKEQGDDELNKLILSELSAERTRLSAEYTRAIRMSWSDVDEQFDDWESNISDLLDKNDVKIKTTVTIKDVKGKNQKYVDYAITGKEELQDLREGIDLISEVNANAHAYRVCISLFDYLRKNGHEDGAIKGAAEDLYRELAEKSDGWNEKWYKVIESSLQLIGNVSWDECWDMVNLPTFGSITKAIIEALLKVGASNAYKQNKVIANESLVRVACEVLDDQMGKVNGKYRVNDDTDVEYFLELLTHLAQFRLNGELRYAEARGSIDFLSEKLDRIQNNAEVLGLSLSQELIDRCYTVTEPNLTIKVTDNVARYDPDLDFSSAEGNVRIYFNGECQYYTMDKDDQYTFYLEPEHEYEVLVTDEYGNSGFHRRSETITVKKGQTYDLSFNFDYYDDTFLEGTIEGDTSEPVKKANMYFRKGHDNKTGEILVSCTYPNYGGSKYRVRLEEGDWTVEISANGYDKKYVNISVSDVIREYKDFSLVSALQITAHIINDQTSSGIPKARITMYNELLSGMERKFTTDNGGHLSYCIDIPTALNKARIEADGYISKIIDIEYNISANKYILGEIRLVPTYTYTVSGKVSDGTNGISGVTVSIINANGEAYSPVTTKADGTYIFNNTAKGTYKLVFSREGYTKVEKNLSVGDKNVTVETVVMTKTDDYIVFDANTGWNAPSAIENTGSITIPETVPTRTNYTFVGWSKTQSEIGYSAEYLAGKTYTFTEGSHTLYAVWKPNTFDVVFHANGGTFQNAQSDTITMKKEYNQPFLMNPEIPVHNEKSFSGYWSLTADGTGTKYKHGESHSDIGNASSDAKHLYAVWGGESQIKLSETAVSYGYDEKNEKAITVTCPGDYTVKTEYKFNNPEPNSGHDYEWLSVDSSNGTIKIQPKRANYSAKAREAVISVTYDYEVKYITVTQVACSEDAPTMTIKRGNTIITDGMNIGAYTTGQPIMETDIVSSNVKLVTAHLRRASGGLSVQSCTSLDKISFDISNLEAGDYKIIVYASNSDTANDYWNQSPFSDGDFEFYFSLVGKPAEGSGKDFASFAEAEKMISYPKKLDWSDIGTINYVEQYWSGGNDSYFYVDSDGYWASASQANGKCTRAASSMALSYMGVTALPKNFNPTACPYAPYAESMGITTRGNDSESSGSAYSISMATFEEWYAKYANDTVGKYSPIVLHMKNNGSIHAFAVFGRDKNDSDYYYIVDSGTGDHISKVKIVEVDGKIRIGEYIKKNGLRNSKYSSSYEMVGVWQYVNDNIEETAKTYTVTYNANGGIGAPAAQTKTEGVALTLSSTVPVYEGYTFKGWATSYDATEAEYQPGASYTNDESVTLFAVWGETNTITVFYDANGGTGIPESAEYLPDEDGYITIDLQEYVPVREGYEFIGWRLHQASKGKSIVGLIYVFLTASIRVQDNDLTLIAVWQKNDAEWPTIIADPVTAYPGEKITVSLDIEDNDGIVIDDNYWSEVVFSDEWGNITYENELSANYSKTLVGDGKIAEIEFNVGEDVAPGYYYMVISIPNVTNGAGERYMFGDIVVEIEVAEKTNSDSGVFDDCICNPKDYTYNVIDDTYCEITGYIGTDTEIKIPEKIDGYIVKGIGKNSFFNEYGLKKIVLADTVEYIGNGAFKECRNLELIKLNEGLKTIYAYSFSYCVKLTEIDIPDSVTTMSGNVFHGCFELSQVGYPLGLTTVLSSNDKVNDYEYNFITPFYFCEKIESIIVPEGVTKLPDYIFKDSLYSLKEVILPESLEVIGAYAFENCDGISEISLNNGLKEIGEEAFSQADGLTYVYIPDTVTTMGHCVFSSCYNLSDIHYPKNLEKVEGSPFCYSNIINVDIPEGVKHLPEDVFGNMTSLREVTLPESLVTIGSSAFSGCTGLKSITIPCQVEVINEYTFSNCTGLIEVDLPEGLKSILHGAFSGCNNLTDINIPDTVTTMGSGIFRQSNNLKKIDYPRNLETTLGSPFEGSGITTISIPEGVTSLPDEVFARSNLKNVILPESLENIGEKAFMACCSLEKIVIPSNVKTINRSTFAYCNNLNEVTLADGLNKICGFAFENCTSIVSIKVPDSVEILETWAFKGCTNLKEINYPLSLNHTTDEHPFWDCDNLECVYIPEGVKVIHSYIFSTCGSLKSVILPNSLVSINDRAFGGCESLTEIYLPENLETIGEGAFSGCSALTEITIPDSVQEIDSYVFNDCSGLKTVDLGEGVENIENFAFSGCSELTEIVIPDSVKDIGMNAFNTCTKLKDIYFNGNAPEVYEAGDMGTFDSDVSILYYREGAKGWNLDSDGKWKGYNVKTWGEPIVTKYTITIDANGGECSTKTLEIVANEGSEGSEYAWVDVNDLPRPTRDGYTLLGWQIEYPYYTNSVKADSGSIYVYKDVTCVAVWKNNSIEYPAIIVEDFSANLGETVTVEFFVENNNKVIINDWPSVYDDAYYPKGNLYYDYEEKNNYSETITGDEKIYELDITFDEDSTPGEYNLYFSFDSVTVNAERYFYLDIPCKVIVSGDGTYTISFDANGGTGIPSEIEVEPGYDEDNPACALVTLPIPVRNGYSFIGWKVIEHEYTRDGIGADVKYYEVEGNTKFVAIWQDNSKPAPKLTINSVSAKAGETVWVECFIENNDGVIFEQGYNSMSIFSRIIPFEPTWKEENYSYNLDGDGKIFSFELKIDEDAAFGECKCAASFCDVFIFSGEEYMFIDVPFTVTVIGDGSYTVSYNANGGSGAPSEQIKTEGKPLTISKDIPNREGYTFLGWATSADAAEAEYQPGDSYTEDADITLYAVWKENIDVVYGDVDGNGKINVLDANFVRRASAKLITLEDNQMKAADVDGNGKVNVLDANYVRRYAAKLIDNFPAEG